MSDHVEAVMDKISPLDPWVFKNITSGYGTYRGERGGVDYHMAHDADGINLWVFADHWVALGRASSLAGGRELLSAHFGDETDDILRMIGWIE